MEHFPRRNPNNIGPFGDVLKSDKGVPTTPDKVYRSVVGEEPIADLYTSGVVRNRASAQGYASPRGEKIYWTRGEEGKSHSVSDNAHLIEAPHSIAVERAVKAHEVTAIYGKDTDGSVVNRLEELRAKLGLEEKNK
ncbi:MAG: hypothetical protein KBC16_03160 [Candidatus Pacebacteria bacterium]|nr:hypothetical protein [Candidatus Paceibacterota bacterium]